MTGDRGLNRTSPDAVQVAPEESDSRKLGTSRLCTRNCVKKVVPLLVLAIGARLVR
jgi:hypothetical protein